MRWMHQGALTHPEPNHILVTNTMLTHWTFSGALFPPMPECFPTLTCFFFFFPLSLGFHFDGSKTKKTKKTLARLDYMQGFQNHFYMFFCTLVKWTHCLYCKGITKVLVLLAGQIIRYTCIFYKSWSVLPLRRKGPWTWDTGAIWWHWTHLTRMGTLGQMAEQFFKKEKKNPEDSICFFCQSQLKFTVRLNRELDMC